MRKKFILYATWIKAQREKTEKKRANCFVFSFTLIFIFIMSNEENMTDIADKETLVTDYFKYIFKQLKKN